MRDMIPISLLREMIAYDPLTGDMTFLPRPRSHFMSDWTHKSWNRRHAGKQAWNRHPRGYRQVFLGVRWSTVGCGRIAYALVHGKWPVPTVDHINRIKDDDRLENLREATIAQQLANRNPYRKRK